MANLPLEAEVPPSQNKENNMSRTTGLYVGSFDPLTVGHMDIIKRAAKLFDCLYVGIATNSAKNYLFTEPERYKMVQEAVRYQGIGNISIISVTDQMTTDVMTKYNIQTLVRGVRNSKDMEDEYILNQYYTNLKYDMEEVILFSRFPAISSTFVKECIKYGKFERLDEKSLFVPANVSNMILDRFKR